MVRAVRVGLAALAAAGITLALFWLMQSLVHRDGHILERDAGIPVIQFRQLLPERRPEPPPPREVEPDPPEPPPQPREITQPEFERPNPAPTALAFDARLPLDGMGPAITRGPSGWAGPGNHLVPLVRISPPYPYRAALAGIEGWVRVEFTVTPNGAVTNPHVVRSRPPKIFDDAAMKAIVKWRFQPPRVDGEPVSVRVAQTIDFHLSDEAIE